MKIIIFTYNKKYYKHEFNGQKNEKRVEKYSLNHTNEKDSPGNNYGEKLSKSISWVQWPSHHKYQKQFYVRFTKFRNDEEKVVNIAK